MTSEQLAAAIRQAIEEAGLKRTALAELAGISESGIRAMEAGHCPLTTRADALLRAMGRSLVLGDPDGPPIVLQAAPRRTRKAKK